MATPNHWFSHWSINNFGWFWMILEYQHHFGNLHIEVSWNRSPKSSVLCSDFQSKCTIPSSTPPENRQILRSPGCVVGVVIHGSSPNAGLHLIRLSSWVLGWVIWVAGTKGKQRVGDCSMIILIPRWKIGWCPMVPPSYVCWFTSRVTLL